MKEKICLNCDYLKQEQMTTIYGVVGKVDYCEVTRHILYPHFLYGNKCGLHHESFLNKIKRILSKD